MATEGIHPKAVVAALREEGSVTAASRVLGLHRNTLSSYLYRHQIDTSQGAKNAVWNAANEPVEHVVSEDTAEWGDIRKLVESRGLTPEDWILSRCRINKWGENEQLRADLEPRRDFLMPARSEGWKPSERMNARSVTEGLTFVLSDHHCPVHDKHLHALTVELLRREKPEVIVVAGDLIDWAGVSRHRKSGTEAGLNESLQGAYDVLRDYRMACNARIVFLDGNHEQRLFNALESKGLVNVANLRRPEDDVSLLSTRHLLRLDELGVEQVFPPEGCGYEHAEFRIPGGPAVRHGWIASPGSGSSALKTLDKLRRSVIIGHTHRQSLVHHTHWIDGVQQQLTAVEAGCMALVTENGMGYSIAPDWQNGFCSVSDGTIELATYKDGVLRWRDRVIS